MKFPKPLTRPRLALPTNAERDRIVDTFGQVTIAPEAASGDAVVNSWLRLLNDHPLLPPTAVEKYHSRAVAGTAIRVAVDHANASPLHMCDIEVMRVTAPNKVELTNVQSCI